VADFPPSLLALGVAARLFLDLDPSRCSFAALRDASVGRLSGVGFRIGEFCLEVSDLNCRRVGRFDSSKSRSLLGIELAKSPHASPADVPGTQKFGRWEEKTYCNISVTSRKCASAAVVGGASGFERLMVGMGTSLSQTAKNSRSFLLRDVTIRLPSSAS